MFNIKSNKLLVYGPMGQKRLDWINKISKLYSIFDIQILVDEILRSNGIQDLSKVDNVMIGYILSEIRWRLSGVIYRYDIIITDIAVICDYIARYHKMLFIMVRLDGDVYVPDEITSRYTDYLINSGIKAVHPNIFLEFYDQVDDYVHIQVPCVFGDGQNVDVNRSNVASTGATVRNNILLWSITNKRECLMVGSELESIRSNLLFKDANVTHVNVKSVVNRISLTNLSPSKVGGEWGDANYNQDWNLDVIYCVGSDRSIYLSGMYKARANLGKGRLTAVVDIMDPNYSEILNDKGLIFMIIRVDVFNSIIFECPVNTIWSPPSSKLSNYVYGYSDLRNHQGYRDNSIKNEKINSSIFSSLLLRVCNDDMPYFKSTIDSLAIKVVKDWRGMIGDWDPVVVALFSLSNMNNPSPDSLLNDFNRLRVDYIYNVPHKGYDKYMLRDIDAKVVGDRVLRKLNTGVITDHIHDGININNNTQMMDVGMFLFNLGLSTDCNASWGCTPDEYLNEWCYFTNIFMKVKGYGYQLFRFNQTIFLKTVTECIRNTLCISASTFHEYRRIAVLRCGGVPIIHPRVSGVFKNNNAILRLKPNDAVAPSGHLINMLIMGSFVPVDLAYWFQVIENNVRMNFNGDKGEYERLYKLAVLDEMSRDSSVDRYHSYADFIIGLHVAKMILFDMGVELSEKVSGYVEGFFFMLVNKYPNFSRPGYQVQDYLRALAQ